MTNGELIEYLEQYDLESEVRLAMQPSWPLAFNVSNVVHESELGEDIDLDARDIVWIAASEGNCSDSPYAPREVWECR